MRLIFVLLLFTLSNNTFSQDHEYNGKDTTFVGKRLSKYLDYLETEYGVERCHIGSTDVLSLDYIMVKLNNGDFVFIRLHKGLNFPDTEKCNCKYRRLRRSKIYMIKKTGGSDLLFEVYDE